MSSKTDPNRERQRKSARKTELRLGSYVETKLREADEKVATAHPKGLKRRAFKPYGDNDNA